MRNHLPAPTATALVPGQALPELKTTSQLDVAIEDHQDSEGEMVHELHRREDSLCDGCGPYTSVRSFRGASKTLTKNSNEYPKAQRTVVTSKKKRIFTTESQ